MRAFQIAYVVGWLLRKPGHETQSGRGATSATPLPLKRGHASTRYSRMYMVSLTIVTTEPKKLIKKLIPSIFVSIT